MQEFLKADGFDEAIIGYGTKKGCDDSLIYDYEKCVTILIRNENMSYEEAVEWMEFNVVDAYVGPKTPIFLRKDLL